MRKKIIQMTVYGWEAWAQSHKWPFKPLWKSWVQMWWRNLSTCVALPHLHSEPSQRVPAEPVEFLRAQGCIEHNSALCATPSPHWLMDARCRGISAANSQQPPGKCWDNLWFHSWLSTPFPIPVPAWLMVSVLAPRPLTPQRQNSASLLALPLPVARFITPWCPALWAAPRKCWIWDCEWKPQITHCTVQTPLLEPLTNLTRSL